MSSFMDTQQTTGVYQVVMPRLGLTMTEGKILEWFKQDGDRVEKGEALFAIENEKATLDIEAPAGGTLEIQAPQGSVVPILQPVGLIHGHSGGSDHSQPISPEGGPNRKSPTVGVQQGQRLTAPVVGAVQKTASPRARAAARQAGIDLGTITGSGIRGMIVVSDLGQAQQIKDKVKATPLARRLAAEAGLDLSEISGSGPRGMVRREDVVRSIDAQAQTQTSPDLGHDIQPLSELRSIIARRLGQSWMERPQVTLTTEADATLLAAARQQLNTEFKKRDLKISFNVFFVKLVAQALHEFPYMNVSMLPEGIYQHPQVNIGLAVDTPRGLMVPVLNDARRKSFETLQQELEGLVERTISGSNQMEDLTGGTFTITNLGAFEIDAFTPIINPPECAILGVGRIHEKPVGLEGQVDLRSMMSLSLSFDHRLVDGSPAARFLQRVKQYIEQPFLWLLWDA
jgi:pyruvate dehydrogenase E2 component (dihydrolipoamide acetyltransferase)